MQINLIDPAFLNIGSHHFDWDLRIMRELCERGHAVRLYCSANAMEKARHAAASVAEVIPLFRLFPYADPQNPVQELSLFLDGAQLMAGNLRKLAPADLWLWPTLFAPQLLACAIARPNARIAAGIHFDPAFKSPNGHIWWPYALDKAKQAGLKLNLGVTTPELQQLYAGLFPGTPLRLLPIAQDGKPADGPKTRLSKIGFFGGQRPEKGVDMLNGLVDSLLAEGFEVVLQDSWNRIKMSNPHPRLTMLGSVENFPAEIAKCDLIVAPLHPEKYRLQLSGIVSESLACGVPVVSSTGTSSSKLITETGAGKLFDRFEHDAIIQAVHEAKRDFASLAQTAFAVSRSWHDEHGTKRFVQTLLD